MLPTLTTTAWILLMVVAALCGIAKTALPGAAVAWTRARIAARRLLDLAPAAPVAANTPTVHPADSTRTPALHAEGRSGYREDQCVPVRLDLAPGDRLAITGPSGAGKTTLLMTLAGLLAAPSLGFAAALEAKIAAGGFGREPPMPR